MRFLYTWLLCLPLALWAHPHVFIDAHVDIQQERTWIVWSFDEMTSAMLMDEYDKNKNQKLEPEEIASLKKNHFLPMAPYSYFVYVFDGQDERLVTTILDFTASLENNKLVYIFSIPTPQLDHYELHFYDSEMYIAMIVKPEFLTCNAPIQCKVEGYDADFYYGYKVNVSH